MLHVLHVNVTGIIILAIGFGIAFAVGFLGGFNDEGRLMIIAGVLVSLIDFTMRVTRQDGHLFYPSRGGALFFIPVWIFGMLWVAFGTYDVMTG
jgi:hypothetical protein